MEKIKRSIDTRELQMVFFVNKIDLSNKLDVASKISGGFKGVFDMNPTILPIPDDAPAQFPRILFNNPPKETISCNISLNRIDLILRTSKMSESQKVKIESLLSDNVNTLTKIILDSLGWEINRLALILRTRISTKEGAINFMRKFLDEKFSDKSKGLQIHRLSEENLIGLKTNHWLRLIAQSKDEKGESVLVISDLNTDKNEKYEIDKSISSKFFNEALINSLKSIDALL